MAKLHKMFIMAAVCFAVGALVFSPTLAEEGDEDYSPGPVSEDDDTALSSGPSGDDDGDPFLDQCMKKMSPECSDEIFNGLFMEDVAITKPCCIELVGMGKECHDGLVKRLLQIPELKPEASKALINSEQIWFACASHAASSPSPI